MAKIEISMNSLDSRGIEPRTTPMLREYYTTKPQARIDRRVLPVPSHEWQQGDSVRLEGDECIVSSDQYWCGRVLVGDEFFARVPPRKGDGSYPRVEPRKVC
ncbi:hypothetical protein F5X98DRAFT_83139 [Xylaria grammica]|nr:hypothetical protein F5X98DRAFT_83139 [Xylaria grammica]